jgi:DNA-binding CsgD family transcriptional regulator
MPDGAIDEGLVDAIYCAASNGSSWGAPLDRFRVLLGSCETSITFWNRAMPQFAQETACQMITREMRGAYSSHFGALDSKMRILGRSKPGYLFNDADHFDEAFVAHDTFYQEFSRWVGTRHTLDMLVHKDCGKDIYLAAMRAPEQGAYDAAAEYTFRQASKHFARAIELNDKLRMAYCAAAALDELTAAILVVARNGRVQFANVVAKVILERSGELRLIGGTLCARSAKIGGQLRAALDRAHAGIRRPSVLRIPFTQGKEWVLWSTPVPDASPLSQPGSPAALLILTDPSRIRLNTSELASLYGLTNAEAELAIALGNGDTLGGFAARRGVKSSTAKTQLLAVLGKTGFHRQADLTRALAAMSRPLADDQVVAKR